MYGMGKHALCAGAQNLAAAGDIALAIERQDWARFRAKCARNELFAILESDQAK